MHAKDNFEVWQYAQIMFQRLAELAVRAQVLAVEALAHQEYLEPVAVGISLEQGTDLQDQLVSVRGAAAYIHGDGDLYGQGQHLEVALAEAFPPYAQRTLTELQRLDMGSAQPQSPYLIDDQVAQGCGIGVQEPVIGLEMLKRQIVDRVSAAVIRITRV